MDDRYPMPAVQHPVSLPFLCMMRPTQSCRASVETLSIFQLSSRRAQRDLLQVQDGRLTQLQFPRAALRDRFRALLRKKGSPECALQYNLGLQHLNMPEDHPYLTEGPKSLLNSCDILLSLDDGTELPAHSQVLARCSSIFANMLDDGPLSCASTTNKVAVPFNDCSREEASKFLSAVYSLRFDKNINEASRHQPFQLLG